MNMKYRIVILLIAVILISGCTTNCIPIKPTAITYDQIGSCYVVVENISYTTSSETGFDCSKIHINETNWVRFNSWIAGSPMSGICEDHK
jgi:hypothetical protein